MYRYWDRVPESLHDNRVRETNKEVKVNLRLKEQVVEVSIRPQRELQERDA